MVKKLSCVDTFVIVYTDHRWHRSLLVSDQSIEFSAGNKVVDHD